MSTSKLVLSALQMRFVEEFGRHRHTEPAMFDYLVLSTTTCVLSTWVILSVHSYSTRDFLSYAVIPVYHKTVHLQLNAQDTYYRINLKSDSHNRLDRIKY